MKKQILTGTLAALVLLASAVAVTVGQSDSARPDCPGKITCPLTGTEVCRDLCPLGVDAVALVSASNRGALTTTSKTAACCMELTGRQPCCSPAKTS